MNENTVSTICITILAILFAGDPDIADAIISYLSKG